MTAGTGTSFFEADQSGIGRAVVVGAVIAAVIVWSFVALVALWAGAHLVESIAMGAFAAFFGGPGFGGMLGAVLYVEHQQARSTETVRVAGPDDHVTRGPETVNDCPVSRGYDQREPADPVSSMR
jgi:hypothetical protein